MICVYLIPDGRFSPLGPVISPIFLTMFLTLATDLSASLFGLLLRYPLAFVGLGLRSFSVSFVGFRISLVVSKFYVNLPSPFFRPLLSRPFTR